MVGVGACSVLGDLGIALALHAQLVDTEQPAALGEEISRADHYLSCPTGLDLPAQRQYIDGKVLFRKDASEVNVFGINAPWTNFANFAGMPSSGEREAAESCTNYVDGMVQTGRQNGIKTSDKIVIEIHHCDLSSLDNYRQEGMRNVDFTFPGILLQFTAGAWCNRESRENYADRSKCVIATTSTVHIMIRVREDQAVMIDTTDFGGQRAC